MGQAPKEPDRFSSIKVRTGRAGASGIAEQGDGGRGVALLCNMELLTV
jgi:hypothetical protein